MTRQQLIQKMAVAIADKEGFFVSEAHARARNMRFPTKAQRNANPGNIRKWKDAGGRPYPADGGYVDFVAWASDRFPGATREELSQRAIDEGWRILRVLVSQYLSGRYTQGKPPTLQEMFHVYAPAADGNDPEGYAQFVANKLGVRPNRRPMDLVTA